MKRLWLVDAGYVHASGVGLLAPPGRINYLRLRHVIERELGGVWRGYYFNSYQNEANEGRDRFNAWLQKAPPRGPGLVVQLYPLKTQPARHPFCPECGHQVRLQCPHGSAHRLFMQRQVGVDVGIATIALTQASQYDILTLTTGDADLLDAVTHLSEAGREIEIAGFGQSVAVELQARADRFLRLEEHLEEIAD